MKKVAWLLGFSVMVGVLAFGPPAQSLKVRVAFAGAHCEACTSQLRATLGALKGVQFDPADVRPGQSPEFWSSRFEIALRDVAAMDIGAIAKAVAATETPHKAQVAPGLFLLLPWKATMLRADRQNLRPALADVAGVNAATAVQGDIYAWVPLDGSGRARLSEVHQTLAGAGIIDRPGAEDSSGWLISYDAARTLARQSGKPLLVVFR
jgi:hypothetical protein